MTIRTTAYAVLSVVLPLIGYIPALVSGFTGGRISLALLAFHAAGFILAAVSLKQTGQRALDISTRMRFAVLFGTLGLFANAAAFEYHLFAALFQTPAVH